MSLTREQLLEMGMNEAQITAILATQEREATVTAEERAPAFREVQPHNDRVIGLGTVVPVNCGEAMAPTSLFDLQAYARGTLVRFPDFAEGQPFVARVRRPSMLVLAKSGKIPNSLLVSANELFSKGGGGMDSDSDSMLADMYDICEIICDAALQEPTYQQIKDAGLELSDDQLTAIFNYTQTGAKALESFR